MNQTTTHTIAVRDTLLIAAAAIVLFVPFTGRTHLFDWDEINFAESAREMIVTGDYLNVRINFELFWEKPPLFIWMQVLSMKLFGINEFAARIPNAVAGILTLSLLYNAGRTLFNRRFGLLWALVYAGSMLPHFYFKSGLIDPWFNLFIFSGIWAFIRFLETNSERLSLIVLSAALIGLGTLTKGPVALLMFLLSGFVFLILKKLKLKLGFKALFFYIVTYLFVGGFWFILQALAGNTEILIDFFNYQVELFGQKVAGHGGFPGYHVVVLLAGVFPASLFMLKSFKKNETDSLPQKLYKQWMMILFWVVLVVFSVAKTKIVHYSSLAYFPLSFLAVYAIHKTSEKALPERKSVSFGILFFAVVWGTLVSALPIIDKYKTELIESGKIRDKFTTANLAADADWSGFEWLFGLFLIAGIVVSLTIFREHYLKKITGIFLTSLIFVNLTTLFVTPRIEKYSQNAAIEFLENHQNHNYSFYTFGYKSYADYFYGRITPAQSIKSEKELSDTIRTIFVLTKITKTEKFESQYPDYQKLYEKNGFVFYTNK